MIQQQQKIKESAMKRVESQKEIDYQMEHEYMHQRGYVSSGVDEQDQIVKIKSHLLPQKYQPISKYPPIGIVEERRFQKKTINPNVYNTASLESKFQEIQVTLIRENQNLRSQNYFLAQEVRGFYEREKKHKRKRQKYLKLIKELSSERQSYKIQFLRLKELVLDEIERIQRDHLHQTNELVFMGESQITHQEDKSQTKKSTCIEHIHLETEQTAFFNLEELKQKVHHSFDHYCHSYAGTLNDDIADSSSKPIKNNFQTILPTSESEDEKDAYFSREILKKRYLHLQDH